MLFRACFDSENDGQRVLPFDPLGSAEEIEEKEEESKISAATSNGSLTGSLRLENLHEDELEEEITFEDESTGRSLSKEEGLPGILPLLLGQPKSPSPPIPIDLVLEVVGASGFAYYPEDASRTDTFCVVLVDGVEVHRTGVVVNDTSPIWTVQTNSVCLLPNLGPSQAVRVDVFRKGGLLLAHGGGAANLKIGDVEHFAETLASLEGRRVDFQPDPETRPRVALALRARTATPADKAFLKPSKSKTQPNPTQLLTGTIGGFLASSRQLLDLASSSDDDLQMDGDRAADPPTPAVHPKGSPAHASDTDFKNVTSQSLLKPSKKTVLVDGTKQTAYRVWPGPDPDQPVQETEYLTKGQLRAFAKDPSKHWIKAGSGDYGAVYLEILGCDGLPNMDTELVNGLTDAFVACIFEDTFVRSSIVFDTLCPRWVPWSDRAFCFPIAHPSSILFLGVFDYDEGILEEHDPIGRVVLHPGRFEAGTVYTLTYPLHHKDNQEESRGTITLRLRVDWTCPPGTVAKAQNFVPPPRFLVNTKTSQGHDVLRYLTRGSVDMMEVTTTSTKMYVNELMDYWGRYCLLLDSVFGVWLWRGRVTIPLPFGGDEVSLWCPVDSAILFLTLILAVEQPRFLPSLVLYGVAYLLLAHNYRLSTHPDPWSRIASFPETCLRRVGWEGNPVVIAPGTGVTATKDLQKLEEYRTYRTMGFLYEILTNGLELYRVYSKNTPVDISSVKKSGSGGVLAKFYEGYLYYFHLMFRMLCKYIRILRNFVNWNSSGTYKFTWNLLILATGWAIFPNKHLAIWPVRAFVWLFFGPWVKLLDTFWIHRYYRTEEDLLRDGIPETTVEMKEDIAKRPNIMEPILNSTWLQKMSLSGRIVIEDNLKLQDFREVKFGKFAERIPAVEHSRFPSVPNASSFAQPYGDSTTNRKGDFADIPPEAKNWSFIAGQKLEGVMVPVQTVEVPSGKKV